MRTQAAATRMSCEDFAESQDFSTQIDEQNWDGGFDAEALFRVMCAEANAQGVVLIDKDAFWYETYFWNVWKCTEKGLS